MFGPVFTAAFDSDCEACDERILEGQEARMMDGGGAVHAACPRTTISRPVCPHCFLVHAITQEDCDG